VKWFVRATVLLFCLMMADQPADAAKLKAFVSIPPQKFFVEKIAGELAEVSVLVPPGSDPHTFEPKPRQMAELANTAVYFTVGIDFEKAWLQKIVAANPKMRIVHTDEGLAKIPIAEHLHGQQALQKAGAQRYVSSQDPQDLQEGSPDPHVWLSPPLVKIQARNIADALVAIDSTNRTRYEENYAAFQREIEALDVELKSLFADTCGAQFMVVHPSWGYFAEAYGLVQIPIEVEGKDPKPVQLKELIQHAKKHGIQVIFVQPQFSKKSAETVSREIGGQVVYADPLAENWAENLREVSRKFKAALR
jgi:zinc transport system substrate-binding protein